MPMIRYEIRNEYSLADSELYRASEKDDPDALLEAVSMAALVGFLRQLGDLAEFAAEIFHNLHEEVMVTAARGHGLMTRVQQLETEIPSIERAFYSQKDHSSLFYHAGVDWHPNIRLDHNLVTQGELPRFIRDSYEECRAPPRLFLLDKFDVAGAGACLKRYSDPSFFKAEMAEINVDVQREKKIRKSKKKGPRWRDRETPEVLSSHSKLHQLFLEERIENGVENPSLNTILKRRLTGFPFDLKTEKSYMEKLLSPSPDHKVLHEVNTNSSLLKSATYNHDESGFEIFEARRSPPSSPDGEENTNNSFMYEANKSPTDDELCEIPNSYPRAATYGFSSTLDRVPDEKIVSVDAQNHGEGSLSVYQSDDTASEIDNYVDAPSTMVDAPSTMESEMDGEIELRLKSDSTSLFVRSESLISDVDEGNNSSDSHSIGDTTIFVQGNNASTKQMSVFSTDSPSTSTENQQTEIFHAEGFRDDNLSENEMVDSTSYQKIADEDFQVDHLSEHVVSDNTCSVTHAITDHTSEFEQLTPSVCSNGSLLHSDSEEVVGNCTLKAHELDETVSTFNDKEEKANLDNSPRSSAGEHLVTEPNLESPCISNIPATDSSVEISLYSLNEDACDGKDSTSNMINNLSKDGSLDTLSSEHEIPGKLEDEFYKVLRNSTVYPVTFHHGESMESAISKEDSHTDVLDDEDSNGSIESLFPFVTEPSVGKKLEETSLVSDQISKVERNHSNSSIDNQILNSPDRPGFDLHAEEVIFKEATVNNETLAVETLRPIEVVGQQGIGLTHYVFPNDSEGLESLCCMPEALDEAAGTEGTVELDGISLCLNSPRHEVTEISGSAGLKPVNELDVLLDKCDIQAYKSSTSGMPVVSDSASLNKTVEEHDNSFKDSGVDEFVNDEICPSECHVESDVEKMGPTASAFEWDFCNSVNNDLPKSEVSDILPNSDILVQVDHGLQTEQCGIDREQELVCQNDPNSDGPSWPVDYDTAESIALEKVKLSQLDQELVHPMDQLCSVIPPINLFPETNQMNLGDLPPLPPLPPVEWRMGKLLHASPSLEDELVRHLLSVPSDNVSSPVPPTSADNVETSPPSASVNHINTSLDEMNHIQTETAPEAASKEEDVENGYASLVANALHETTDIPPKSKTEQQQIIAPASKGVSSSPAVEAASKEEDIENGYASFVANAFHETTNIPPKTKTEQQQIIVPASEGVFSSPAVEYGVKNGNQTLKLPSSYNPLIDDAAILNKSKLRKVTERVRPEIRKVDERDSFLEQIRTKSFNLKPAMALRPSIRGPDTNLRVATILEKANAIRQAFAGSDEDDSDSWSDS